MRDEITAVELRQGRLQRPADFTGSRLVLFRQIFVRHGLPAAVLGVLLLIMSSDLRLLGWESIAAGVDNPIRYAGAALTIFVALAVYSYVRFRRLKPRQLGWILYLGALSLWEEWLFRVAGPQVLTQVGVSLTGAIILSNLLFAVMHYFTLRWRIHWCVGAFLGGMAFSFNFQQQGDLLLIAGIHWLATFLNTPRPPAGSAPVA
jgi:hypothetical protein